LPNVMLLIILGILCGPIFHVFDVDSLGTVVPFIAPLAIAFIGFNSGMQMNISDVMAQSGRAILLSILGFLISTILVGIFLHFTFNLRWAYSLLLSSAWGGVSTATVTAVCKHLKVSERTHTTLTMSSIIDDLIVMVSALTILNYILLGGMNVYDISLALMENVSISFFIGVIIGIAWLNVLWFSRRGDYTYTFTLAAILLVYSITEMLGGTGGIAIFLFGLVLGNSEAMAKFFRMKVDLLKMTELKTLMGKFHSELTFMLSTFFFVFIGLFYVYTGILTLFLGLIISFLLHAARFVGVKISTWRSSLASDLPAIGLIVGKGAAAAALSALPLAYSLPQADLLSSIALNVILLTNILSILLPVLLFKLSRK
ncbi:MAG: cation:proton antiporter, partial [Candidatus Bathyarchaeota archaeon]